MGRFWVLCSPLFSLLPSPEKIPTQPRRERGKRAQPAFPEPKKTNYFLGYSPDPLKKHQYLEWIGRAKENERNLGDKSGFKGYLITFYFKATRKNVLFSISQRRKHPTRWRLLEISFFISKNNNHRRRKITIIIIIIKKQRAAIK